jgi:hypothetical protein
MRDIRRGRVKIVNTSWLAVNTLLIHRKKLISLYKPLQRSAMDAYDKISPNAYQFADDTQLTKSFL